MLGFNHVYLIGLLLCGSSSLGCHALQAGGRVRIVKGRRASTTVPSNGYPQVHISKARIKGGRSRAAAGGGRAGRRASLTTTTTDQAAEGGTESSDGASEGNSRIAGGGGQRRKMVKSNSTASMKLMARLRRKMKDARHVPDVSKMLRDGLPYLTEIEATEVQLALAVSIYAHSKTTATGSDTSSSADGHLDDRVKAGVEVCLQLGRLGMGRDALLAAILGGVLRPETVKQHSTHPGFGRAPVTVVDIREGFGKNVARLVAGLEHVTCVEETAHAVLRGTPSSGSSVGNRSGATASERARPLEGEGGGQEEEGEPLSPAMLIGARERSPAEPGGWGGRGRGRKTRSLREASALEQKRSKIVGESLRNLIVSEAADWQVLTLRLAVQLQALKNSTSDGSSWKDQQVRQATMDRSSVYEKVVEATKATLKQALRDAPAFTNQVGVEGVFDAVAVRVVLEARKWQGESLESYTQRSEDLCYQASPCAMSVIKKLYPWSQSQQRVKDYVVKPKPNGYQSLHATQLVPDVTDMTRHGPSVAIEFQVRSKEMHQKAEFGLAAHWSYKESSSSMPGGLGWVEDTNTTITRPHTRKVFVFGPDRKIWELDKGSATAGDALGRSYMQKFYEGALLHDRRNIKSGAKGQGAKRKTRTAWVNGREVCAVISITVPEISAREYIRKHLHFTLCHVLSGRFLSLPRQCPLLGDGFEDVLFFFTICECGQFVHHVDASYLLKNGDVFDVAQTSHQAPEDSSQDASEKQPSAKDGKRRNPAEESSSSSWRALSAPPTRGLAD
ncbi:unnamed protein product [Ectocarpus sp. CCAP 1310/34]|nr:unnamed protein product [Ectocarpus sp. CCAP 1310/34]